MLSENVYAYHVFIDRLLDEVIDSKVRRDPDAAKRVLHTAGQLVARRVEPTERVMAAKAGDG